MRKKTTSYSLLALALVTATIAISSDANGQEREVRPATTGPPAWVLDALESGDAPEPPAYGPPAWVVEAWQSGERPARPMGPPEWVLARQEIATERGLPGPPAAVLEAWQNGDGFSLPGPPEFVFELFGF